MENENPTPDRQIEVNGSLSDPMTQARLQAVAKAKSPKGIKARHVVKTTETIKVASAFGAVSKEIEVEKTVEKTLVGEQEKKTADVPTEDQLDTELRAKLVANGTPPDQIEAKIAEAKEVRAKLNSLWSIPGLNDKTEAYDGEAKERSELRAESNNAYSGLDQHISVSAHPMGSPLNNDNGPGSSGVRIRFSGKPKE